MWLPTPRLIGGRRSMCERTSRAVLHFALATRTLGPKDFVYGTWTMDSHSFRRYQRYCV